MRLLIISRVAAITRKSPAMFRSSISISPMYSMYCRVTSSIGMSYMSTSSFLMRYSNRSSGPSKTSSLTL